VSLAGRTTLFRDAWANITNDPFVLSTIAGVKLVFNSHPVRASMPRDFGMSDDEKRLVDKEIQGMIEKGAVIEVQPCEGQFVSNIFLRPKKNGSMRPIINLKKLNAFVITPHFKMEHLLSFLPFIRHNMFLTSLDLKDAYFSIPIDTRFRKYLRFTWQGRLFEFTCLCFGLSSAPYVFTKVMKPVFSQLRREGICSSYYIDDSIYANLDSNVAVAHTSRALTLLESLGFTVNLKKSSLTPSRVLTHLGFVINTETMTVSLPDEKVLRLKAACAELLANPHTTVRKLAQVIGLIVSSFLAVRYGRLHYRQLEFFTRELSWWVQNVESNNGRGISSILGLMRNDLSVFTDASMLGWGAALVDKDTNKVLKECSGEWSLTEKGFHINVLELKAIQLALLCFEPLLAKEVLVHCDNTTAVSYVNKFGGSHSSQLNSISIEIWDWCIARNLNLQAVHVAGSDNLLADSLSRSFPVSNTEWSLDSQVFLRLSAVFGRPDVDLFASRLNHKLPVYFSWKPDPGSAFCDAFRAPWEGIFGFAFPPFNQIARTLYKLEHEEALILLVCPYWPSQPWFPHLCSLLVARPVRLPSCLSLLRCPVTRTPHPLLPRLQLIACLLSRSQQWQVDCQRRLSPSLRLAGQHLPSTVTLLPSSDGLRFVLGKDKLLTAIPLRRL